MRDGRISVCPLCGSRASTGSLRAHVGSVRCLAHAMEQGVIFDADQRALLLQAQAWDKAVRTAAGAATQGAQARKLRVVSDAR